ncbi:hypothetical protein NJT12_15750 [Flavobacterium sp. AC]|uniref:DNA methylase adenine-specific domain-containing protein n=1 Tax=Flavobacterium azizsancarii TaxID=2961580 RepID=A0ABT4WES9_9FLAO|nr:hypothetical protein [Flavobacterium azizsancarii]MDA6071069.1 hypothetical protein [Flavobacterium azizsancarii]
MRLTDAEFYRLRDEIASADVFTASKILRERNTFQREDGTPLQYRLVNIKDLCKNEYNLNISHYVSTAVANEKIDLLKVNKKLDDLSKELKIATANHNKFLKELGLLPI